MRLLFAVSLLLFPLNLLAETDSKSSTWLMSLNRFTFSDDLRAFLDVQPRLAIRDPKSGQDGHFDTLLLRGALGLQVHKQLGLYQGYALIPTYDPTKVEHRSFQEALLSQAIDESLSLTHRFRFEQRFLEGNDTLALRVRYFARLQQKLPSIHPRISLAINEEVFINTNDAEDGPQAGFNQNRFFLGANYALSNSSSIDIGYQNQYVDGRNGSNDTSNHIIFLGIINSFSFTD